MRIFADLNVDTYGNFISNCVCLSSIKETINNSHLLIYFRNNRPYKIPLLECMKADLFFSLHENEYLPIQAISSNSSRLKINNEFWEENKLYDADLVLSGNMIYENMLNANEFIHLTPPSHTKSNAIKFLEQKGLDLTKWFACIFWKEPNDGYRSNNIVRTIQNYQPYLDAIDFIINELGGQVVRLGHFNSSRLTPRINLIDLTLHENITDIEVHAVNLARFFVGTASGPISLGHAFGVPTLCCDSISLDGVWDTRHYMLTQSITNKSDGNELSQKEAYDAGLLTNEIFSPRKCLMNKNGVIESISSKGNYLLRKNNSKEIINGIKEIFQFTEKNKHLEKKVHIDKKINKISLPFEQSHQVIQLTPFSKRI